ncbi:late embryogenesis abundant protein 6-like [Hibiscus syriacus]|uniref:late embryogenesis abundant protein 6-like n=1 Tax=Hibiscus syriacus TaxID=106335 RepID=UPI001923CB71|nr:late embryogenesis abundant protein 6-like [Hibiscus syriacus]
MQAVKEKISNMSSSPKKHVNIGKLEKATATTEDEKELAHERRKAKEARAMMEQHQDKVKHLEEMLTPKQPQYLPGYGYDLDHDPALQPEQTTAPPYHLTAHPPPHKHS